MSPVKRDGIALCVVVLAVFAVSASLSIHFIPEPHTSTDYLVAGTVATLFSLGALFLGLIATIYRGTSIFFHRREKSRGQTRGSGRE